MFAAETYLRRRARLCQDLGRGLILLPGNAEAPFNYRGNVYPFRQDSHFLYFFGLDQPDLAGLLDAESGDCWLFGAENDLDSIVWTGPLPSLAELAAQAGVAQVRPPGELAERLARAQAAGREIHYAPPYRGDQVLQLAAWLNLSPQAVEAGISEPLIAAIAAQRLYKSEEEVSEIEEALALTRQMHLTAMSLARPGMREAELMASVQRCASAAHAQAAYGIILSVRGEVLHNPHYRNVLEPGQMLLCDAGAESPRHYAGDITRSFPVDTVFTARQREIYQLVLDMQEAAIEALRPGIPYREVHLLAHRVLAEGMARLGLMKGDPEEAAAAGATALFFPHGLGHLLGLDVHDLESLGEDRIGYAPGQARSSLFGHRYLRLARPLEAGFVLTVEPGIYFIPALISQWMAEGRYAEFVNYDKLAPYFGFGGIRIEDNFLITPGGARLLGPPIPKTLAEVEMIRQ